MHTAWRLSGIGGILLLLVAAAWIWMSRDRPDERDSTRSSGLTIEARCGVAAGRALSSTELSITCGLDEAGIESVIARAVSRFDLQKLVDQAGRDRIENPAALDALVLQLGLSREAVIALLRNADQAASGKPVTPEQFAAELLQRTDPELAVSVIRSSRPPRSEDAPAVQQHQVLEEGDRLQVNCGAVARQDATIERASIVCGPEQEDIEHLIRRLVDESELSGLIAELRQGTLGQTTLVDALSGELPLSRSTVLSLIRQLADSATPADQLVDRLASLSRRHAVLAHRIAGLPVGDPGAERIREQAAGAVAAGDYRAAETLLDAWTRSNHAAATLTKAQSELNRLRERLAQTVDQRDALKRQFADLRRTLAPAASDPEVSDTQADSDRGMLFVSPDRVVLDVPARVHAGERLAFAWRGPNAPDDLIFIAEPDMGENRYFLSDRQRHRTEQGSPAELVAPAEPGRYEVRYFSYRNGTVLARVPLEVAAAQVVLDLPDTINAGALVRFPWRGPTAPGDLLFFAEPGLEENRYPLSDRHRHLAEQGSPAELVAPAEPGRYEVRYFSFNNGKVLHARSLMVR